MTTELLLILAAGAGLLAFWGLRTRFGGRDPAAPGEADDGEAELGEEANLAVLVRDRSRYARNFATDMADPRLDDEERARFRQKYEAAKSTALLELLKIKDDFNRGLAAHGVIDLLLAGNEIDAAKNLFATIDPGVQDSILSTRPDEYACLR